MELLEGHLRDCVESLPQNLRDNSRGTEIDMFGRFT